ncbi:hypothetical protein GF367_03045 [Candidatus Woesearchaeota archaeon]|nr:hypothetical protein [Candidatus Woesearchaeota archaeon]
MNKAQASLGMIILFIAALFIGAIAAGVYITNTNKLQAKTKQTGDDVRKEASSTIFVMDIYGEDGRDGTLEEFRQVIKLPPGSDAVDLENLMLAISTTNATASLTYSGVGNSLTKGNDGYNTFTDEEVGELGDYFNRIGSDIDSNPPVNIGIDLDLDGTNDNVMVCENGVTCDPGDDGSYVLFNLSAAGQIKVQIIDQFGAPMDIAAKSNEVYGNYLSAISDGTTTYGYMTITGDEGAAQPYTIFADQMTVYQVPHTLEEDLDQDGGDESLVINDTHVILHYSSKGDIADQLNDTRGVAYPLGVDLSGGGTPIDTNITLLDNDTSEDYGTLTVMGTTTRASYIDANVTFHITPKDLNHGYYAVQYVEQSEKYQEGVFNDGDILRLYYEAAEPVIEDEFVRIILTTRSGTPTYTEFYAPNIIARQSVAVYPTRFSR